MEAMPPAVKRVMAATDRSASANHASRWAAHLAASYNAELMLLRVLPVNNGGAPAPEEVSEAETDLAAFARELAGARGRALVKADPDPVEAILRAVDEGRPDVVVLGNAGMSGRKRFLLGNIPNRVSHRANCTVIIVNTAGDGTAAEPMIARPTGDGETRMSRRLLNRSWRIGRVFARAGLKELRNRAQPRDEETMRARARRM